MKKIIVLIIGITLIIGMIGCSSTNRNVITSIQSGIGIRAEYDERTQLPLIWVGYIRSLITVIPVQLNTQDPMNEDASRAVSMVSSMDCSVSVTRGIKISERYIINGTDGTNDVQLAKEVLNTPKARFLEK